MKFFEEHFSRHHFRHNPHKWFVALVLSPIHHAEMRYKRQYHLKFSHAKKLFLFDMLLLCTTVVLLALSLFWWLYDPTVTELVHLDVVATTETNRLQSGDDVRLDVEVHNQSDVILTNAQLMLHLPQGFILDNTSLGQQRDTSQSIILPLSDLPPNERHTSTISGRYYGTIGSHESIQTMLVYTQAGRSTPESDIHRLFLTARDPSIVLSVQVPDYIIPNVDVPIRVTAENTQDHRIPPFKVQFDEDVVSWSIGTSTVGTFSPPSSHWSVPTLDPGEQVELTGRIRIPTNIYEPIIRWDITTVLEVEEVALTESTTSASLTLAVPRAVIAGSWSDPYIAFGDQSLLTLTVQNTGNVTLSSPHIRSAGRDIAFSVDTLAPGQSVPVSLPLSAVQSAIEQREEGPVFVPTLSFVASVQDIPDYAYTQSIDVPPLPVATTLSLNQHARYYTAEGDQLGRGPLPPRVGEETKYWVFTQIQNTVGDLRNIAFSTTLAPGVRWTGRSSVSRGNDLVFDQASRTASWQGRSMNPYEAVGLYFEVAVTPSIQQVGSVPQITTQATAVATDPHIQDTVATSFGTVDASLTADPIGLSKGTRVQ